MNLYGFWTSENPMNLYVFYLQNLFCQPYQKNENGSPIFSSFNKNVVFPKSEFTCVGALEEAETGFIYYDRKSFFLGVFKENC